MVSKNVIFTGYLFGDGYASLSSHCYLFVLPSGVDGTRPVLLDLKEPYWSRQEIHMSSSF